MIKPVSGRPLGSVWSVLGVEDGLVVILAGPFAASRGTPEYLSAPVYIGNEPGFVWTSEDVRLEPKETGLPSPVYAAIWNARPILEVDLLFPLGQLSEEATVAVRDAYWASLNERDLGKSPRLGRQIRSTSDPAAQFQARELERWQRVSGRALAASSGLAASAKFLMGAPWSLTPGDVASLDNSIQVSETFLGPMALASVGPFRVSFTTTLFSQYTGVLSNEDATLLLPGFAVREGKAISVRVQVSDETRGRLEAASPDSDLAAAA